MRLKQVFIHKYKCFESEQIFEVENGVSILVGMNESGKTAALESIAKTNYFQDDTTFTFNLTHDYPRKGKKQIDKTGTDPKAITCTYEIGEILLAEIEDDVGEGIFTDPDLEVTTSYGNRKKWGPIDVKLDEFIEKKTLALGIASKTLNEKLVKVSNTSDLESIISEYSDDKYRDGLEKIRPYFENKWSWDQNPLGEYIARTYIKPNLPKFLYYDEYFSLPSRISIEKLHNEELDDYDYKTAQALFELADINTEEILAAADFEDFIAELEATEAIISEELFKYWKTNKNLQIVFQIDKIEQRDAQDNTRIVEHILDVRVKSKGVSLPLKNRSKGFNWFFSFLVWFKQIQEDKNSQYILLLDEPGLNLHASAQADLLQFIEDLSDEYQIIYTTHSPFMIATEKLARVRTVLEKKDGSVISDSIQEKDPNTLFPLQAALGYDIAQNLFVSPKNLLVEGVSDLIFLQTLSGVLEADNRVCIRNDITIVPTGGLEKVATFISLLRGSKLKIACLLDSYADARGKEKVETLIRDKVIHKSKIRFFDEFLHDYNHADLEDLFVKSDYLQIFNAAFSEHDEIQIDDLNSKIQRIIVQINEYLGIERFNHYRPANELAKMGNDSSYFQSETLDNFEKMFEVINQLFES